MGFCGAVVWVCVAFLLLQNIFGANIPRFSYISRGTGPLILHSRKKSNFHPISKHWTSENVTRLADATEEANIAYFIQVSLATLDLTERLLSRLHHPKNFYALHFDRKIPAYRVVKVVSAIKINPAYNNVHIMQRDSVTYRGITMVLNNLAAITDLLRLGHWHYFINLSGSDYPLVSPVVQRKILAMPHVRERASNFFIVSPQQQWDESKRFRFDKIAVDTALGMSTDREDSNLVILKQTTPLISKLKYEYVKGEGWLILTRDACKYMIESHYARKMLLSMAFSQDASEHYYVSLFWNHPDYNRTIIPHSLRTVYWKLNGVASGQHPYVIDQVLENDGSYSLWKWVSRSPHWFARKFSIANSKIMDDIDNNMNGLGDNVNDSAVQESLKRVEHHLHWLYSVLPESRQGARAKPSDDAWPS